jgi:hypothetical protein
MYYAHASEVEATMELNNITASNSSTLSEAEAFAVVGGLSSAWLLVFLVFLLTIKRRFLGTFVSMETGREWVQSYFVSGTQDAVKKRVLENNKMLWLPIREEVKEWVLENWEIWEEEEPDWFTDPAWKALVDDDMIPTSRLGELGGKKNRRRASASNLLTIRGAGGGLRRRAASSGVTPVA